MEDTPKNIRLVAKVLSLLGSKMAQNGAETRLIIQSMKMIQKGLGIPFSQIGMTRRGIIVRVDNETVQEIHFTEIKNLGINMSCITSLHKICLAVEKGELTDINDIYDQIDKVNPMAYNKIALVFIEAIAAALFSYLNGGNVNVGIAAFVGGMALMSTRFFLHSRGFFDIFISMTAAFFGCMSAFLTSKYALDASIGETNLSIIATTLLLVPGFPFINGFLDVFKGYTDIGMVRLTHAFVLTFAAAFGLLGALWFKSLGL